MNEQDTISQVTAALAGEVRRFPRHYADTFICKGYKFKYVQDVTPPYLNPFDDPHTKETVIVAHKDGWLRGIIFVNGEPVRLLIE